MKTRPRIGINSHSQKADIGEAPLDERAGENT